MPQAHASQFRRRLTLAAFALTFAVGVLGLNGYLGARQSQVRLEEVSHSYRQLSAAREIAVVTRQWMAQLRHIEAGADESVMAKEIAATRVAVSASLAELEEVTKNFIEREDDSATEIDHVAKLAGLLGEVGVISDVLLTGHSRTPELDRKVDALSVELAALTELIEADELDEVDDATARAQASAQQTTLVAAALLGLGLAVTLMVMGGLSRRLRTAIAKTLDAASSVARGDFDARVGLEGEDEFAELGRSFDKMVAELDASLKAREAAAAEARALAREAGIAQITTGVLHNIGNALNSVNISLELVSDSGIDTRLVRLAQVGRMLAAHEQDLGRFLSEDPRGSKLPRYLSVLAPELEQDAATFTDELGRLRERVEHVIRILRTYQEHGITRLDEEIVEPAQLVAFAIEVALSGTRQRRFEIVRELTGPKRVTLDKHRTLEILINLVRNAGDALDEAMAAGLEHPRLELAVEHDANERMICFVVRDNGVGIEADKLEQVFAHGYTTKGAEGSGFGLHASANAAVEMGGRLRADSGGPGKGASFTLELPLRDDSRAKP
jgi:signal transduction histidine kinase